MDDNYIPMGECKHGNMYLLRSRNLRYGVYNSETNGFKGLRRKFNNLFLFEEYHWDMGEPYGTAKPIDNLGVCDVADDPDKLYLRLLRKQYRELDDHNLELTRELARVKLENAQAEMAGDEKEQEDVDEGADGGCLG